MADPDEFEAAQARGDALRSTQPTAVAARYDGRLRRVVVRLSTGLDVAFAPRDAEGLETATPEELNAIEITPSGLGLHFPKLDADLYLPALLDGYLGSRNWTTARLGKHSKPQQQRRARRAPTDGSAVGHVERLRNTAAQVLRERSRK